MRRSIMDDDQQFCLRWNNHQSTLISVFDTLLENGTLVDCTLAAEGKFLKAHKVVLSACSPYFASLLSQQYDKHPIFILKDVKFQELRAMMDYMYRGEVNISQDQLAALLKAAESLQIKGLSDSRGGTSSSGGNNGGGGGQKQTTNEHKQMPVPASATGKSGPSGYTLEQKRPLHSMGQSSIDSQDISGSREGSSSPTSRKRKKIRRRSLDNIMADNHEHSNSSSHSLHVNSSVPPSNTSAAIASVPTIAAQSSSSTPTIAAAVSGGSVAGLNVTKKTESVSNTKLEGMEHDLDNDNDDGNQDENEKPVSHGKKEQNHKRKSQHIDNDNGKDSSDMLIEPKSEYDDGNDENVEDLTLDEEELLEDLEQAGPSHGGGEGSSQGYAQWQVDRSQDEVFMAAQEAAGQQRDPQVKHDKSEQTDITPEEFELDDCLLESNDIVITQNKDGFVLHVKKLGNITTAKISTSDCDEQQQQQHQNQQQQHHHQEIVTDESVEKQHTIIATGSSSATTAITTTCHTIKLPSAECELINLRKATPSTSTAAVITPATAIIQTQSQEHGGIVTANAQAINNLLGLREVHLQQKVIGPRIKYSRAKFPSPIPHQNNSNSGQTTGSTTVQMTEKSEPSEKKYEIAEIDLNPQASASIISDLVKYAEIDDIELPDGTKIGIGFAPAEISEHIQNTQATQVTAESNSPSHSPGRSGQEATITKSYTILTTTPMKQQQTYELSLSDSSMTQSDDNDKLYVCRHCGKKYRWKSTLRRHENVECGGKEPCHPCPYCTYKAKQRGNLGVHVRKHHPSMPQLESKRGRRS